MDVEVVVRKDSDSAEKQQIITSKFACNARDVDQMVGMTMALEKAVAEGEKADTLGNIRNYTQELLDDEEGDMAKVSNQLTSSVGVAVNAQFARIGESAQVAEYLSKIVRARDAPQMASDLADKLIGEVRDARSGAGLFNNKYTRDAIVGRIVRKIDNLINAILQQKANIKRACENSADLREYDVIVARLQTQGKSPN